MSQVYSQEVNIWQFRFNKKVYLKKRGEETISSKNEDILGGEELRRDFFVKSVYAVITYRHWSAHYNRTN